MPCGDGSVRTLRRKAPSLFYQRITDPTRCSETLPMKCVCEFCAIDVLRCISVTHKSDAFYLRFEISVHFKTRPRVVFLGLFTYVVHRYLKIMTSYQRDLETVERSAY